MNVLSSSSISRRKFLNTAVISAGLATLSPQISLASGRRRNRLRVHFEHETHYGVRQITVNGTQLLTGCGFGFIGSKSGVDGPNNITSCNSNNGGIMTPSDDPQGPRLPHALHFQIDESKPRRLNFGGHVGPSPEGFATVSMPMDCRGSEFTYFRHPGSFYVTGIENHRVDSSVGRYDQNHFSEKNEDGQSAYIAHVPGQHTWGEIIGREYTLRVQLTGTTRPMGLFFVEHPELGGGVRNVEFSFGPMNPNETANVTDYIRVKRTRGGYSF